MCLIHRLTRARSPYALCASAAPRAQSHMHNASGPMIKNDQNALEVEHSDPEAEQGGHWVSPRAQQPCAPSAATVAGRRVGHLVPSRHQSPKAAAMDRLCSPVTHRCDLCRTRAQGRMYNISGHEVATQEVTAQGPRDIYNGGFGTEAWFVARDSEPGHARSL